MGRRTWCPPSSQATSCHCLWEVRGVLASGASPRCIFFLVQHSLDFPYASTEDALAAGKNYKDLEIQSQAGKKSSAFFASRSLSRACAAPQLPRTAALPLLAGWPQEEPGGICDFLFQLNSSSNLQEGLGCLLLPHSVGRVGGAGGMSGLPADHGDIPECRGGWCMSHLIKNSHPKACPLTTPLKGEAEGGEQPCSSPLAPPPLLARSSSSTGR